jgi:hypothetical protein
MLLFDVSEEYDYSGIDGYKGTKHFSVPVFIREMHGMRCSKPTHKRNDSHFFFTSRCWKDKDNWFRFLLQPTVFFPIVKLAATADNLN